MWCFCLYGVLGGCIILGSFQLVLFRRKFFVFVGKEWGQISSIASVLYHHHSAIMYERALKRSFAAFVHFFVIRWSHNGSWRSLTRFSGSVAQTNRTVMDAQDMAAIVSNRHQTTSYSTHEVSETNGHVVLAGVRNGRGGSYARTGQKSPSGW